MSRMAGPSALRVQDGVTSLTDDESEHLQIIRSKSIPQAVQETLTRMILRGDFQAGDKLNEIELATALKVSRGPVREAFRALEESGLVRSEKNRGVFVREVTLEEAKDLYDVRACLEAFACRLLAPKITEGQALELERIVEEMEPAYSRQDVESFYPRNVHFHNRIVEMANSPKLVSLYRNLINEVHLISRIGIAREGGRLIANPEHSEIVAALKAHDGPRAEKLITDHVLSSRDRFLQFLQV
jgi:DNA-binding GntR family transcriptional regulator